MAVEAFDTQMLVKLESGRILPPAFPTRLWTGEGPILLDIGDGYSTVPWIGTTFGNMETEGVVNVEKTAGGIPKRLSVAFGIDDRRGDVRVAITRTDLGVLAATLYFVVRETAGQSLEQEHWSFTKVANADPEPTLSISNGLEMLYTGNNTFKIGMWPSEREDFRDILVEGNSIELTGDVGAGTEGMTADVGVLFATVETGTAFDVWTVTTDGHGSFTEAAAGNTLARFYDPFKDQDWNFVQDRNGLPLVIRGRTGEMAYNAGLWTFDIENRVHDADRLISDVWADSVQRSKYTGDLFFEFTGELEAGLDFSWPN